MSREDLDGRNNEETMRVCPWQLASDKWNDPNYSPVSTIYRQLHDDFRQEINLNHAAVENMGVLTPDKAKGKYNRMKNDMILVQMSYKKVGMAMDL